MTLCVIWQVERGRQCYLACRKSSRRSSATVRRSTTSTSRRRWSCRPPPTRSPWVNCCSSSSTTTTTSSRFMFRAYITLKWLFFNWASVTSPFLISRIWYGQENWKSQGMLGKTQFVKGGVQIVVNSLISGRNSVFFFNLITFNLYTFWSQSS